MACPATFWPNTHIPDSPPSHTCPKWVFLEGSFITKKRKTCAFTFHESASWSSFTCFTPHITKRVKNRDRISTLALRAGDVWPPVGRLVTATLWLVTPFLKTMSQFSCACVVALFIFTQPHTPQDGVGWGGRTVTAELCSETPRHPRLTQRGSQSPHLDPQALRDLPPITSLSPPPPTLPPPSWPQPHELPLCFSSSAGMVLSQDFGTESSFCLRRALPPAHV